MLVRNQCMKRYRTLWKRINVPTSSVFYIDSLFTCIFKSCMPLSNFRGEMIRRLPFIRIRSRHGLSSPYVFSIRPCTRFPLYSRHLSSHLWIISVEKRQDGCTSCAYKISMSWFLMLRASFMLALLRAAIPFFLRLRERKFVRKRETKGRKKGEFRIQIIRSKVFRWF